MRFRDAAALLLLGTLVFAAPARVQAPLRLAATVPEADLIPEGIALDSVTRTLYLSSLWKRKIVAVSPDGAFRDFVRTGQDGLWSVLGLKVDPARRTLLACSGVDRPGMLDFSAADLGKSAVFEFDLATGKTLRIFRAPGTGHLFNDLVVTRTGAIYVTDSTEGSVYAIDRDSGRVERFRPAGRLVYPNGIAIAPDERTLFVADERTIYAVDLASKRRRELGHPAGAHLGQADGLYFDRGALIAIQNGDPPVRVARFRLSPSLDRVTGEILLASGDPRLAEPTTAAIGGKTLYLVGDSQLSAIGKDGRLRTREKLVPVRIYELPLGPDPRSSNSARRTP